LSLWEYFPEGCGVRELIALGGRDLCAQRLTENGRQNVRTLSVSHCKCAALALAASHNPLIPDVPIVHRAVGIEGLKVDQTV
jgi:hypothetical protein